MKFGVLRVIGLIAGLNAVGFSAQSAEVQSFTPENDKFPLIAEKLGLLGYNSEVLAELNFYVESKEIEICDIDSYCEYVDLKDTDPGINDIILKSRTHN